MIEVKNNDEMKVSTTGSIAEIAADLFIITREIYKGLKKKNEKDAESFKNLILYGNTFLFKCEDDDDGFAEMLMGKLLISLIESAIEEK